MERSLTRYAWLSIAAAVVTIALKAGAFFLTGSVGLLSDALESLVNLVAAAMTLTMLSIASRPADEDHPHGHTKAEYFASGAEGAMILLAAVGIVWAAVTRLLAPRPVEAPLIGVAVSAAATVLNFAAARVLLRAGHRHHSIALEADAHHLMADVWTSTGVLVAIGIIALTGWNILDPLIGIAVAVNIVRTGFQLVRRSALGLLDTALPPEEISAMRAVLERHERAGVRFHAVRTRQAAARRFVSMHVLVPGSWSVSRSHALADQIEREISGVLPHTNVLTHVEPIEEQVSYEDEPLDR
jgi:cation diffusion facilitator family transporter